MSTDPSVLDRIVKAYDIRGTTPDEMNDDVAFALGVAFADFVKSPTVLVGRDMRVTGESLAESFSRGVTSRGVNVVNLGLASTDLVYFAAGSLDAPGAMFTASHNPAEYNGIKFCLSGARPLGIDTGLATIRDAAKEVLAGRGPADVAAFGTIAERDMLNDFADHVVSFIDVDSLIPMKVVADTANGMGGLIVPVVFDRLPMMQLEVMYPELDGSFPNHPADPIQPANQRDLQARVVSGGFDIGLAFDGDGDRVIGVDHVGNIVDGDHLLALAAIDMHERKVLDGNGVVVTVMTNAGFHEAMAKHGISVVTTPVGDRSVLLALDENNYALGGEQSGHIIYRKDATTGDGLLAGVRLVDLVRRKNVTLQKLAQDAMTSLPQVLINVRVESVASDLATQFAQEIAAAERDLNGVGRVLLRASGTEPLVRVMVEAQFEETANSVAQRLAASVIKRLGGSR